MENNPEEGDTVSSSEHTKDSTKESSLMMIIPECCTQGWDSCTHTNRSQKKKKINIAL